MAETVLTSRRALLLDGRTARPGRLRLSDAELRFEPLDGSAPAGVDLAAVRRVAVGRGRRAALVVDGADGTLRLRCFGVRGVARLVVEVLVQQQRSDAP